MSAPACAAGTVLDARYRLIERLGAGGQGEVWRAHDASRGIDVALKVLDPMLAQDPRGWAGLRHEHEINRRLDHPFILEVFPPERLGELMVLPMELAAGGDLRRLRGRGYLEIVPVLIELALALEHAHDRGVIHRDLKPSNVLFDSRARTKLADFGIAELAASRPAPATGSPFSASPEQLRGESPQPSDDIYGLGALIYELLSGYPPHYPHFDPLKIRSEPAPPLTPVVPIPAALAALVTRMLDKDPTHRPASMREVIEELDTALQDTLAFGFEVLEQELEEAGEEEAPTHAALRAARARTALTMQPLTGSHRTAELGSAAWHARAGRSGGLTRDRDSLENTGPLRGPHLQPPREPPVRSLITALAALPRPAQTPAPAPAAPAARAAPPAAAPDDDPFPDLAMPGWDEEPAPADAGPGRWLLALGASLALLLGMVLLWPRAPAPAPAAAVGDSPAELRFVARRAALEQRLAALEARGAAQWGGAGYASARTLAAEAAGAHDAGSVPMAEERLQRAGSLLDQVEGGASAALAAQLAAGEKALAAGQQELALQDFALARRIGPADPRVQAGEQRARSLSGVLPLLASARNAESSHSYSRALTDYSRVLAADPGNPSALAGLARVTAAQDDERFAKAIGRGFTALAAGRLKEAREAFEKARALRPNAVEPAEGLKRVAAAAAVRGYTSEQAHGAALEAAGRWQEALALYDSALQTDPLLAFAREGRERVAVHLPVEHTLQGLIDNPGQLLAQAKQAEARALVQQVHGQVNAPLTLKAQAARVEALLAQLALPVHLTLISDGYTAVSIQGLSTLGLFGRRDLELKPGHYTLSGARDGYREVRREITVAPGEENVTINVTCTEPLPPT